MAMRVTKKVNNNVALALDQAGNEVVIFGRGVGFPPTPYLLRDERQIKRVFRDVNARVAEAAAMISDEVLVVSSDIVDLARVELGEATRLSPNLVFTLADHLQFAVERVGENITIENPLAADVAYVYPREYALGKTALGMVKGRVGVELPPTEACSVALHIVSGEAGEGQGDVSLVVRSARDIEKITGMVAEHLGVRISDTIAMGDAKVDIPMLEACGVGVAMGSGGEEIRAMADYVTADVDKDGLCHAFRHLGLIEGPPSGELSAQRPRPPTSLKLKNVRNVRLARGKLGSDT